MTVFVKNRFSVGIEDHQRPTCRKCPERLILMHGNGLDPVAFKIEQLLRCATAYPEQLARIRADQHTFTANIRVPRKRCCIKLGQTGNHCPFHGQRYAFDRPLAETGDGTSCARFDNEKCRVDSERLALG